MTIRNWLAKKISAKYSEVGKKVAFFNIGLPVWTPRRYDKFAEEGYQKNVVAYASIREVAKGAASVPLTLYRMRGDKRIDIPEHPLLKLLNRPNPLQGGSSFFEAVYAFYQIAGNAYIEGVGAEGRPPIELYTHRPDRIRVIPGGFGLPSGYEYEVNGMKSVWDVNPITGASPLLHLKTFNPLDDWYGMSSIEAAAFGIDIHNETNAWNKALLENGARPAGALVYEGSSGTDNLAKDQFDRLKEEVQENYVGAKNAGRPMLLDGGLKWQEMSLSPKDMEYIENKNSSSRDIALCFGVPPMILGIPGDNTYSNQKEARLALWEQTILPLVKLVVGELNNWLTPLFGEDLRLGYNEDKLNALAPRRAEVWDKVKDADHLTDNEKREATGYGPIDGGDILYKPMNLVPMGTSFTDNSKSDDGTKTFNLSPDDRIREWYIQTRMLEAFEKGMERRLFDLLSDQAKKSGEAFASDGREGVELSFNTHAAELEGLLRAQYDVVMKAFGQRILDSMKTAAEAPESKDTLDFFTSMLNRWINKFVGLKVVEIAATTKKRIQEAILAGEAAEESIRQIGDRIVKDTSGKIAWSRARTIAKTETHSAAMAANDQAAEATGVEFKRRWLSAKNADVRPSHAAADGQVRSKDEPFDVGGAKLTRPGDPGGPADEVINCRCIVDYITRSI